MIIRAYAKVNISLKILGIRSDGYHELKSYMQALPDLYDVLEIIEADETVITCSDERLSCGDDNLVNKALKLLGKNAKVHIEKRIPIAAGLAGGSADAAAVLFAFLGGSAESYDLASKLGADVPFSLMAIQYQGKCAAIAEGTGTRLTRTAPLKARIVTKTPDLQVSTPAVYKEYDRMNNPEMIEIKETETNMLDAKALVESLNFALTEGNDLQASAISLCPEIQATLDELSKEHPVYGKPLKVQQSGSGPTCFAIYKEE